MSDKKYFYTYEKIDFDEKYDKLRQDTYDRASKAKDFRQQEYLANRALRIGHEIALYDTLNYFKQEDKVGLVSTDSFLINDDGDSCSDVPIDMIDSGSDLLPESFSDWKKDLLSEKELLHQKQINQYLYDALVNMSHESIYMKMTIAKFLYDSDYDETMSEEQREYWASDFAIFDILEDEGRNTAQTLYLMWDNGATENTRRWQHYDMLQRIKKTLACFKDYYYKPEKRNKKVNPVVIEAVESDDDYDESVYEEEFAVA
jgi:hypothetical protein